VNWKCKLGFHQWKNGILPVKGYYYRECVRCPRVERRRSTYLESSWKNWTEEGVKNSER